MTLAKRSVIALDISKKSTGVCVLTLEEGGKPSIDHLSSIRPPSIDKFNKVYHVPQQFMLDKLRHVFNRFAGWQQDVSVAIENPFPGTTSSDIAFYYFYSVLEMCDEFGLDVVGYGPMFLKSFIKQAAYLPYKEGGKALTKTQILEIYTTSTYPTNPEWLPKPEKITDDDQLDALYIALMACLLQLPFLPRVNDILLKESFTEDVKAPETLTSQFPIRSLLNSKNYYFKRMVDQQYDPDFRMNFRLHPCDGMPQQFKLSRQQAKERKLMDMSSTYFYPFSKMHNIDIMIDRYINDTWIPTYPDGTRICDKDHKDKNGILVREGNPLMTGREIIIDYLAQILQSTKAHVQKMYDTYPDTTIQFDAAGNLFMYPYKTRKFKGETDVK